MNDDDLLSMAYPHDSMTDPRRRNPPLEPEFGADLRTPTPLDVGPAWDVTVSGDHVVSVGPAGMHVLGLGGTRVGELRDLPVLRQVAVDGGLVAVTARHAGVYLVDMATPRRPEVLAVYDSVELATGVALRDGVLAITNRHYGVELVDVSDPRRPRFLASIVTGEAQSVTIDGSIAYVGNWLDQTLAVLDIAERGAPRLVARVPLDGFGDGVAVQGDVCAVATGHHDHRQTDPRRWDGQAFITPAMLRGGYGAGHGVELWSTSRSGEPELLSRLKGPRNFVGSPDTWRVAWSGDRLVSADSHNGVFIIDAADPRHPRHLAFSRLPRMEDAGAPSPRLQPLCHPATGVAVVGSSVYVASPSWQLGVIESALPEQGDERDQVVVTPSSTTVQSSIPARRVRASADGIHIDEIALVAPGTVAAACGEQGIALLDPTDLRVGHRHPSPGLVQHIAVVGDLLYASAGAAGLGLYRIEDRQLVHVGAADVGGVVRQVIPMRDQGVALALVEGNSVAVLDISDPQAPAVIDSTPLDGPIYCRILPEGSYTGRLAAAVSLAGGVSWLTLAAPPPSGRVLASTGRRLCPITEGVAQLSEQAALLVRDGGYELLAPGSVRLAGPDELIRPAGPRLSGVPTIIDRTLIVTNRASGGVRILDITEIDRPREVWSGRVDGNPGRPVLTPAGLLVPCGRAGVHRLPVC